MTAEAILPSAKPSDAAEALVMMETISTPGAISRVTSQLTAPSTTFATFPFSTLRALIFILRRIVSSGSRHSNRIAIEIELLHYSQMPLQPPQDAPVYQGTIMRFSNGNGFVFLHRVVSYRCTAVHCSVGSFNGNSKPREPLLKSRTARILNRSRIIDTEPQNLIA